jgi:hypothetical protein
MVRAAHATVFVVMAISTFAVLYAGATGATGPWVPVAVVLLLAEVIVFVGNGMSCPLTILAREYGAESGHVFDTFMPNHVMQRSFRTLTVLAAIGLTLLGLRGLGVLA